MSTPTPTPTPTPTIEPSMESTKFPWRKYKHHHTQEWKTEEATRKHNIIARRIARTAICKANRAEAKILNIGRISDAFNIFLEAGNLEDNPTLHPLIKERCERWFFTKNQWKTVINFIKLYNNTAKDYTNYENCVIKKIYEYVNNNFLTPSQIAKYAKYTLTQIKIIQKV